jgi:hypothetical protein
MLKWYHGHKVWTSDNWKRVIWSDESPYFTLFLTLRRVWRTPNPECLVPICRTRERFYDRLDRNVMVFCCSNYYPSWPNYCKGVSTWTGWVISCIPWSRCYFRTVMQFSNMILPPLTEQKPFSHDFKSMNLDYNTTLASAITLWILWNNFFQF